MRYRQSAIGYRAIGIGYRVIGIGYRVIGIGLSVALAACSHETLERAETEAVVPVSVETAAIGTIQSTVNVTGMVQPAPGADWTITAPEAARIAELPKAEGDAVAHLRIPAIDVDKIVVEGVEVGDLKRGPGHYPDSPMPGQPGNAAIAGHRTTYGAPFNRLDELGQGDEILVTTAQGAFRYEVQRSLIVKPDEVEVLDDFGDDRLTLTACHPKYSARERIVVVASLVGEAAPAPAGDAAPTTEES